MGALAEFARDLIRERTRAVLRPEGVSAAGREKPLRGCPGPTSLYGGNIDMSDGLMYSVQFSFQVFV
nr:hypothetical protein [Thermosporothrix hazakensis]